MSTRKLQPIQIGFMDGVSMATEAQKSCRVYLYLISSNRYGAKKVKPPPSAASSDLIGHTCARARSSHLDYFKSTASLCFDRVERPLGRSSVRVTRTQTTCKPSVSDSNNNREAPSVNDDEASLPAEEPLTPQRKGLLAAQMSATCCCVRSRSDRRSREQLYPVCPLCLGPRRRAPAPPFPRAPPEL